MKRNYDNLSRVFYQLTGLQPHFWSNCSTRVAVNDSRLNQEQF